MQRAPILNGAAPPCSACRPAGPRAFVCPWLQVEAAHVDRKGMVRAVDTDGRRREVTLQMKWLADGQLKVHVQSRQEQYTGVADAQVRLRPHGGFSVRAQTWTSGTGAFAALSDFVYFECAAASREADGEL